ncbi:MAG: ferrous iron transporter B, partial [Synechococcaceae cyanobacterium]|nr:ferrous iron transporter B [Synechococcaceae cyanobacterium]
MIDSTRTDCSRGDDGRHRRRRRRRWGPVLAVGSRCHGDTGATAGSRGGLTVALLGMPNTGKSTVYNRLTGGNAHIANWPGLTVDLLRGAMPPDRHGRPYELVDLPGIHDLSGSSEDEAIVQRYLRQSPPDLVLVVLNATHLASQLRLLLQVRQLGLPTVAALNMSDEARRYGIEIDAEGLADTLGVPVVMISARRNQGIPALIDALHRQGEPGRHDEGVPAGSLPGGDDGEAIAALLAPHLRLPARMRVRRSRLVDRVLLHPLVGLVLFLLIVLAVFQALYALGSPVQDLLGLLFDGIQTRLLEPGLTAIGAPELVRGFLIDGLWLGVATVTTFLPIIFLFYLLLAVVEDSGYLPRAAFLMDGFMRWLGLDGRAFVLQVMGFGCHVPSILGTRVIRDRGMRLLSMLCIPFALGQARLTVFLFMAAVFFPDPWWAAGLVVFGFYVLSFVAMVITGLIFQRVYPSGEAFVLELPPYRRASLRTILRRGWTQMVNFSVTTRSFIVLGAAAIWLLTHLPPGAVQGSGATIADGIGRLFQPLLAPIGMNPALTVSLFFGFIAKEILLGAMAVIYKTSEANLGGVIGAAITPLPGHGGGPAAGVEESALRAAVAGLVAAAGLAAGP